MKFLVSLTNCREYSSSPFIQMLNNPVPTTSSKSVIHRLCAGVCLSPCVLLASTLGVGIRFGCLLFKQPAVSKMANWTLFSSTASTVMKRRRQILKHGGLGFGQVDFSWAMTMTGSGFRVFVGLWMSLAGKWG